MVDPTLKQRGHDPIQAVVTALATHPATGQLPSPPNRKPLHMGDLLRSFALMLVLGGQGQHAVDHDLFAEAGADDVERAVQRREDVAAHVVPQRHQKQLVAHQ